MRATEAMPSPTQASRWADLAPASLSGFVGGQPLVRRERPCDWWLLAGLISFAVVGCAGHYSGPDVTAQSDEFSKDIKIKGVSRSEVPNLVDFATGGITRSWFIRSWVNKDTGAVRHQLYVDLGYHYAWKFFQSATDDTATALNFVSIDRSVIDCHSSCSYTETVGVDLNDATLRSRLSKGTEYRVKLSAKSGDSVVLPISVDMLAHQFAEVDKYAHRQSALAPNPSPTASPRQAPAKPKPKPAGQPSPN